MDGINDLSLKRSLENIQLTQRLLDQTQLRLATGRKVNSALDGADSFFASFSLRSETADLSRIFDNLGQNIHVIESAQNGLEAAINNLEIQQSLVRQAIDEGAFRPDESLSNLILADDPVAYYRLNETAGNAINLGTGVTGDAQYQGGVVRGADALYEYESEPSAQFDGVNDIVRIPNSTDINVGNQPLRTVELTFNAEETGRRQVLFEEGGGTNNLVIYIEDGRVRASARDQGDFGPFDISAEIQPGQTYHVAVTLDSVDSNTFRAYLDGELIGEAAINRSLSSHTGGIGIGRLNGSTFFLDGNQGGNGAGFRGRISDVAIYNEALDQSDFEARTNALEPVDANFQLAQDIEELKAQLDQITQDTGYRGVNLLRGDSLVAQFNKEGTSSLTISGFDVTSDALGMDDLGIASRAEAELALSTITSTIDRLRGFSSSLAIDLNVISTREDFIQNSINTKEEGADKLVNADLQEESAQLLALETSLALGINSLASGTRAKSNIFEILFVGNDQGLFNAI